MANLHESVLKRQAPARIDDLWLTPYEEDTRSNDVAHLHAERLFEWADDSMIDELLDDEERLNALVVEVADAAFQLGYNSQQLQPPGTLVASCLGCNSPNDNGSCGAHHSSSNNSIHRLKMSQIGPQNEAIVSQNLHRATTLFALTANLLSKRKSYKLAALMTPEPPVGVSYPNFVPMLAMSGKRGFCCVLQLFALLDNASHAFPKASMYAAACLSLAVSRRPSQAFALLDPERMAPAIAKYLRHSLDLIHNTECIVEECFGLAAFINLLPLLYCFGDWKGVHAPMLGKSQMVPGLTTLMFNILYNLHQGKEESDDRIDVAFDTDKFPELKPAIVFIDPRIKSGVLRDHPMSWAVVTALEVLVKWNSRGIPVLTEKILTTDAGPEPISRLFLEIQPQMESLCAEARPIGVQLMKDLLEGNHKLSDSNLKEFPQEFLLSRRMDKLARRCAWCGKESNVDLCSGGCLGLARYCSKSHQKKHWRRHKEFCKNQN